MDTNDEAVKKTEQVINALDYAQKHNLDINKEQDIKKILEEVDPEHTSKEEIEEFAKLLQNANTFLEITKKKGLKKRLLPN